MISFSVKSVIVNGCLIECVHLCLCSRDNIIPLVVLVFQTVPFKKKKRKDHGVIEIDIPPSLIIVFPEDLK